jgi:hypothetical protein
MAIEIAPEPAVVSESRSIRSQKRAFWRLSAWGGATAVALAALAVVMQTDAGSERLQVAIAQAVQPERVIAMIDKPRVTETAAETKRLETQVQKLAADRDRLVARLASLESTLDDVTGSIKRQTAPAAAPAPTIQISTPAPVLQAAPATAPPTMAPLAMPAVNESAVTWSSNQPVQAGTPIPEPVPLPPVRVAVAPASEPATELPRKPELGVDIGGGANLEVLNARWAAVKANFGPALGGLHARAGHDPRPGSTDYRLLAGPLPNAAAAAQLCARFAAARVTCRTVKFDGERLAQR